MARITPKSLKDYPWYLRWFFRMQVKKYGAVLEPVLIWGRSPKVFLGFLALLLALNRKKSPIEAQLRSLIMVKVAQSNQCAFCVDMNAMILIERGASEQKLHDLSQFRHSPLFTERERAALEYAEALLKPDKNVPSELFEKLKIHFTEDEIVELTALSAFQNLSNTFNAALDIPAHGFCKISDYPPSN